MEKELKGLEEGPKAKIHIDWLRATPPKYQTGKFQAMIAYLVSGSKNSLPFMTDKLSKCIDA